MDVMGSLRALRRRWILTLALLLLTLAGAGALAHRPGPYTSESQVVLLPSEQNSAINGRNPYLSFGGSISLTADLVRREVTDPRTVQALAAQGYSAPYQVTDDTNTAGPVLDVTVTGSSKALVERTLYGVTAEIGRRLDIMQAGVKHASKITALTVSVDLTPTLKLSQKARTVVVILGLGLILTIAIPQIVDASIMRRAARKAAKDDQDPGPDPGGPGPAGRDESSYASRPARPEGRPARDGASYGSSRGDSPDRSLRDPVMSPDREPAEFRPSPRQPDPAATRSYQPTSRSEKASPRTRPADRDYGPADRDYEIGHPRSGEADPSPR
jgi:hypothetical protein